MQPALGPLEGAGRDVDPDDLVEGRRGHQLAQEGALAAAEIDDAVGAEVGERPQDHVDPQPCQRDDRRRRRLPRRLSCGRLSCGRLSLRAAVVDPLLDSGEDVLDLGQTCQGVGDVTPAAGQVAAGDEVLLRVVAQPAATGADELVHLVAPDPVVLRPVEDGKQDVEVGEGIGDGEGADEGEIDVGRVAQRGTSGSSGTVRASTDHPRGAKRRSTSSGPWLVGVAGTWMVSGIATPASSGRAVHRPFIAVLKTRPSATASIEDAAYGRSLT